MKSAWPNDPLPPRQQLTLVSEPQLPERPLRNARPWFLAIGTVIGLLSAWLVWRPRRNFKLAGFALLGAIAVFAVSFAIPDRYTSRAVLRIGPVLAPKRIVPALAPEPPAERLRKLQGRILEANTLEMVLTSRHLMLYPEERTRQTMGEVVETMRRNVAITPVGGDAFVLSFTYPNRYKAQAAVRQMITQFVERDVVEQRRLPAENPEVRRAWEMRVGSNVEVLDPASLPEIPVFPNRAAIGAVGLPLGLLAGVFLQRRKRAVQAA